MPKTTHFWTAYTARLTRPTASIKILKNADTASTMSFCRASVWPNYDIDDKGESKVHSNVFGFSEDGWYCLFISSWLSQIFDSLYHHALVFSSSIAIIPRILISQ